MYAVAHFFKKKFHYLPTGIQFSRASLNGAVTQHSTSRTKQFAPAVKLDLPLFRIFHYVSRLICKILNRFILIRSNVNLHLRGIYLYSLANNKEPWPHLTCDPSRLILQHVTRGFSFILLFQTLHQGMCSVDSSSRDHVVVWSSVASAQGICLHFHDT